MVQSSSLALPRRLGLVAALGAVLVPPFLGACFCSPSRPETRGCDDPITDFSGITRMSVVEARVVRGAQGGRHVQFQVEAEGTGLRGCVALRYDMHLPTDEPSFSGSETRVASDVSGSRVVTTPVYIFLSDGGPRMDSGPRTITVEALGRTAGASVDLGFDPFAPDAARVPDAALDAPSTPDAPAMEDAPSSEDAPASEDAPVSEDAPGGEDAR